MTNLPQFGPNPNSLNFQIQATPNIVLPPINTYGPEKGFRVNTDIRFDFVNSDGNSIGLEDLEFRVEAPAGGNEYTYEVAPEVRAPDGTIVEKAKLATEKSKVFRLSFGIDEAVEIKELGLEKVEVPKINVPESVIGQIQPEDILDDKNNARGVMRSAQFDIEKALKACDAPTQFTLRALLLRDAYLTALTEHLDGKPDATVEDFDDQGFIDSLNQLLAEAQGEKATKQRVLLPKFYKRQSQVENWKATQGEQVRNGLRSDITSVFNPDRIKAITQWQIEGN